jgi:DNA repair protein RecO (recombination protein O)
MDESRNTRAIILNSQAYRENDSLVSVYTLEFGRLDLLARGTKKLTSKMSGHLEPLNSVDLMIIPGRGFDYIGGVLTRHSHLNIREDLNKLYFVGQIIALFSSLVRGGEKDEQLFFLLETYLERIDLEPDFNKEKGSLFYIRFALSFLTELGYQPEMSACLVCGQKLQAGANYFDLKNGGVICELCAEKIKKSPFGVIEGQEEFKLTNLLTISNNCVKIIRYFINSDNRQPVRISQRVLKETAALIKKFIVFVK